METKTNIVSKAMLLVRSTGARLAALFVMVLGLGAPAYAAVPATDPAPTDPLSGGGDAIFSTLGSYISGHLVTLAFGLAAISIAAGLVLRWVKKGVHA